MAKRDGFYKRGRFWWVSTDPITGREKSTRCTDLVAAKGWKTERERRKHDPAYARAATATFGEWAGKLIEQKSLKIKPISLRAYPQYFGHWVRLIPSSTLLADIGPGTFDDFIALRRKDRVEDYTIGKELTGMKTLLRLAKRSGCYAGDLDGLVPIDFDPSGKPGERALTPEEFLALVPKLTPAQLAFVCVAIALGCRRSEVMSVEAIAEDATLVFIAGTKTAGARRTVPILSVFRPMLVAVRHNVPVPKATAWNFNRDLWAACDAAGIPRCCPNDLRRTHASWLKEADVDSDVVRRLMGHKTSQLVNLVYGRPRVEKLAASAEHSIANSPNKHDIRELPAPRKPNIPWKSATSEGLTEGAHGLSVDPLNRVHSDKHADVDGSPADETGRVQIRTDTTTRQSDLGTAALPESDIRSVNEQRTSRLTALAVADPVAARPGLAAARALDAAYRDDMPAVEAALADMVQALGVGR